MAKKPSFNFGATAKPKRTKSGGKKSGKGKASGKKGGSAWRSYVGSNAPIPD